MFHDYRLQSVHRDAVSLLLFCLSLHYQMHKKNLLEAQYYIFITIPMTTLTVGIERRLKDRANYDNNKGLLIFDRPIIEDDICQQVNRVNISNTVISLTH